MDRSLSTWRWHLKQPVYCLYSLAHRGSTALRTHGRSLASRESPKSFAHASLGADVPASHFRSQHLLWQQQFHRISSSPVCKAAQVAEQRTSAQGLPQAESKQLRLHNTMTKRLEEVTARPGTDNTIAMYVCGPTVYDYSHIGHARVYISFDILFRFLKRLGFNVTYVRNITDVDDKIIARAKEGCEDPSELAVRFADEFRADMATLNCLPPTMEPTATSFIPQMVNSIETIIDHGHAYASGSDVFFDVVSLPGYGRLSGRSQDDNRAGERVAVNSSKRNPEDFALWKSAKEGEPSWESPWGRGRPGWHIECSAMIRELMGPVIDIHGGGRDLEFPHHENELAQSQAASCSCDQEHMRDGTDFVRLWVHNGFVNVDSEKMSKSLGNFFTIRDVTRQYHPFVLRWFLLSSGYRAPINYTQRGLEEASERVYTVAQTLQDTANVLQENGQEAVAASSQASEELEERKGPGQELVDSAMSAMCEDLNSAAVLGAISSPLTNMNELLYTRKGRKAPGRLKELASLQQAVQQSLELLGLDMPDVPLLLQQLRLMALTRGTISEEEIQSAMDKRAAARRDKNFEAADAVRQELAQRGIALQDSPQGTSWRPTPRLDAGDDIR
ncbi:hypothetical protein WJX74_005695 [Apatococcus lobatus]|uniref:cysteine--tRNA ligase n=1 Tax=Apatococcus lobatus TaxID=904363 RepID=A0AAW1RVH9_9CHLO